MNDNPNCSTIEQRAVRHGRSAVQCCHELWYDPGCTIDCSGENKFVGRLFSEKLYLFYREYLSSKQSII